jgi:GNAT superfamily N-acetyltransferase
VTTTLRPTGPETPLPDGTGRTRHFAVCVNSRPVGGIRASAQDDPARPGARTGRLSELEITDGPRRGRGTVAVLAAEEVLRGWDCHRVRANIPAESGPALALADSLGYRPTGRRMAKPLPAEPPALPAGTAGRPVTPAGYPAWLHHEQTGFAEELAREAEAEGRDPSRAEETAGRILAGMLPDGPATTGQVLRTLAADGQDVAMLWLSLSPPEGATGGWVTSVEVYEPFRRRGHGRAVMRLAEQECVAAGLDALGLHVHAWNDGALALYESLGYRTTLVHLAKPLR